jgi:hypothetical protein
VEPDYLKHAEEFIQRLRLGRPMAPQSTASSTVVPNQVVINAPRDCVIYITSPSDSGAPPRPRDAGS